MAVDLPDGWFSSADIKIYRQIFASLPQGAVVVEIGAWKGRSLASVADLIILKEHKVVAVDTFLGSLNDPDHQEEVKKVNIYELFLKNMEQFKLLPHLTICPMTSRLASQNFLKQSFDFIFIDADHSYRGVFEDIKAWYPKLKANGLFAGHDYPFPAVAKAVHDCFPDENIIFYKPSNIWSLPPAPDSPLMGNIQKYFPHFECQEIISTPRG